MIGKAGKLAGPISAMMTTTEEETLTPIKCLRDDCPDLILVKERRNYPADGVFVSMPGFPKMNDVDCEVDTSGNSAHA